MSEEQKNELIQYMYTFAWKFGLNFHLPTEELIIQRVGETMALPEDFIDNMFPPTVNKIDYNNDIDFVD
jgi:hypothetical protein